MAQTTAERVQAYRVRQRERIAALETQVAEQAERIEGLEADLADARAEIARLSGSKCRHPAEAVADGQCTACGEWL